MAELNRLEKGAKGIEIIKNIVEILAIIIAGIWALIVFSIKDAPQLSQEFKVDAGIELAEIKNDPHNPFKSFRDTCLLDLNIKIKNIGYKDLYVDSFRTIIWEVDAHKIALSNYLYIDQLFEDLSYNQETNPKTPALVDLIHRSTAIPGFYPGNVDRAEDYTFFIPIDYNKAVIAGYVVYGHRKKWFSGEEAFSFNGFSWYEQSIPDNKRMKDNNDDLAITK